MNAKPLEGLGIEIEATCHFLEDLAHNLRARELFGTAHLCRLQAESLRHARTIALGSFSDMARELNSLAEIGGEVTA